MGFIKFIIILFLSLPLLASADANSIQTIYCPTSVFIGIKIQNNPKGAALSCEQVQAPLENAYKRILEISPVELTAPMLVVRNTELSTGASYNWVTTTMTMGIFDISKLDEQIVFFYHEMGHKIYFEYFSKTIKEVADRLPVFQKYAAFIAKCDISDERPQDCETDTSLKELTEANDSFSKDFDKYFWIDSAYNELFADVVASMASGDKNAIAKAVGPCGKSKSACEHRLFSKNTVDSYVGTNIYTRFAPIRRDIWDTWVTPRLHDPQELLHELATIFTVVSSTVYKEDYAKPHGLMAMHEVKGLKEALNISQTQSRTSFMKRPVLQEK